MEVFYCRHKVCEITFVLVRLVQYVQGLNMKLICSRHAENIVVKQHSGSMQSTCQCVY